MAILKLLRNNTLYTSRDAAINALETTGANRADGEMWLASYSVTEGSTTVTKSILAVKRTNGITYFDNDGTSADITEQIKNAIGNLNNGGKTSTDGTNVQVKVTQVDGIVSAVNIDKDNTQSKITNVSDSVAAGSFVSSVSQTNGQISVKKGTLTSSDSVISIDKSDTTNGNIKLGVNIDGTTIKKNTSNKLYVDASQVAPVQSVSGDTNAIEVESSGTARTVKLKLKGDSILTADGTNGLYATLSLVYDTANKKIKLVGKDGTTALGATIDTSDFVKDGMLQSAEFVVDPEGQTTGQYIKLTWNTDAGTEPMYVNVSALVDEYKAGDGLELIGIDKHTFIAKRDTDSESFLSISANGIKISGIQNAINTKVNSLDLLATSANAKKSDAKSFVTTTISETDGIVKNESVSVTYGDYDENTDGIATMSATKTYVDNAVSSGVGSLTADKTYIDITTEEGSVKVSGIKSTLNASGTTFTGTTGIADGADVASAVITYVTGVLGNLDNGGKTSTDGTNVQVKVTQVDGIVSAVNIDKDNTQSKITNVSDSVAAGSFVSSVSQTNGQISVKKGTLTSSDSVISIDKSDTTNGNIKLGVNIDGTTIKKNTSNKLYVDASQLISTDTNNALKKGTDNLLLIDTIDCGTY